MAVVLSPEDKRDFSLETVGIDTEKELPEKYFPSKKWKFLTQMTSYQCVAHSLATCMAYNEMKLGLAPNDYSRGWAYMLEKSKRDIGDGSVTRGVLKNANKIGQVGYDDFRYGQNITYVLWPLYQKRKEELSTKASPFRIKNYFRLTSPDEIKRCVLERGACIFDYPCYKGNGGIPAKRLKSNHSDKIVSWHSVTCIGWTEDAWIIQNSYNPISRIKYIPFDYCDFKKLECWGITVDETSPRIKRPNAFVRFFRGIGYGFRYVWFEILRFWHFLESIVVVTE